MKPECRKEFCIGYNITEYIQSRIELDGAKTEIASKNDKLNEISFLQSHVIRKPLANIMGLSGILSSMDLDANLKNVNDLIIASAEELDKVIKDITAASTTD